MTDQPMYPHLVLDEERALPNGAKRRIRIVATDDSRLVLEAHDGEDALGADRWLEIEHTACEEEWIAIHLLTTKLLMTESLLAGHRAQAERVRSSLTAAIRICGKPADPPKEGEVRQHIDDIPLPRIAESVATVLVKKTKEAEECETVLREAVYFSHGVSLVSDTPLLAICKTVKELLGEAKR